MALVDQLPSGWGGYSTEQKLAWFNANGVTASDLANAGVDQASIDWIEANRYPKPVVIDAAAQERLSIEEELRARVEADRQEAIRQEQIRAQQLAAQEEAERQEAIRQEYARQEAEAQRLADLRNRLLAGNPDGDELTRRVVIESVNNKWTPQQTLDFVNTQFGANKTMADYERAVSNFFAPAVSNLLANGKTEADIRQLGADQGIIPSVIDAAVRNNISQLTQNDILSKTSNLIGTKTENNQTFQTLDVPGLIKFADDNKLSYADVATALATKFPTLKTSDLVFEKDRQQISALAKDTADPKDATKTIKSVSYADALKEAITKGIGLENLARFFGQTSEQFKTTISSNLGSFADSLRASGVNAEAGLSDLLGIQPKDTTAALKTLDTDKAITGSLNQKEAGGLTYNEILDEVEASGMTIEDFVTRYFGQGKTDLLTGLKSEAKFTPEQRDLRDDYNAFASTFNKDNPLTYSKISDYLASKQLTDDQASSLFGIPAKDLADYRTDTKITGQLNAEKQDDNRLSLNEILDVISGSGMDIKSFVEKYFGKDQTDLITSLTKEKEYTPEQRNIRDDYNVFTSTFNKDNPLTYSKISDYLASKQLTDAEASSLFGIPAKDLADYRTDTKIIGQLNQEKADDGNLSLSEILGVIDSSGMTIDNFVKQYFGTGQEALATSLTNEKKFTPEQRAIRETYNDFVTGLGDKKPTLADVANFVDTNKLTDAQAESILGVPAKDLGTYRRDTFITSTLNSLEKSDNRLDYTEIVTFAKDNNIPFTEVAKYLATPDKQESLVKTLQDTQTDMDRSPAERLEFQLNQITNSGKQSGTWDKNEGWEHHAEKMTNYLTSLGVTDLRNIATKVEDRQTQEAFEAGSGDNVYTDYRTVTVPHVVYYDKTTGKELQAVDQRNNNGSWEFGSEGSGKGSTGYILAPTSKDGVGGVGVTSQWREKYGVQEYAMPVAFVAAVMAPYLLPEIIGAAPAAVAGVEGVAAQAALSGTGVTGALISAGVPVSVAPYAAQMLVNGVYNGTVSEATGGDFDKGFIAGVAPVIGQITSNAVNAMLSDLQLPAGIDKAAGNAMMQLVATGKLDPAQMFVAGVAPSVSKAIQDATGLTSAQTKLVLDTVVTQGKNLQALLNPATAVNFVIANQGVFDKIGTAAATGTAGITRSDPVDLGAFNEDQRTQLTSPVSPTLSTTGQDTTAFLEGNNIYNTGQGQFISVDPGQLRTLEEVYGFDPTAGGQAQLGLKTGAAGTTTGDAGIAELMANVRRPDQYQMDLVGAEYGTPYSVDWNNIQKTITTTSYQLTDDKGNKFNVPSGATFLRNARGDVIGYTSKGVSYEYVDGQMMPRIDVSGVGQQVAEPAAPKTTSFATQVFNAVNGTVQDMLNSDNATVRSVGEKLQRNIGLAGDLVKGALTTIGSPAELLTTIFNGNPNNPVSNYLANLKEDITAAQAASDPKWAEAKAALNKELTRIGATEGQISQALATIDKYANNPRMIAETIASTVPSVIPGVAAFKAAQYFGLSATASYLTGAGFAATTAQSDLKDMAASTFDRIRSDLQKSNPELTAAELDTKAAAGTAMSMRAAGVLSLGTSFALQMLPLPDVAKNALANHVIRETGQELFEEPAMKVLSNIWQGKPVWSDLGRTAVETIFATGPIAAATSSLGGNPKDAAKIVSWEVVDAAPNSQIKLLTNQNNQIVTNRNGQPILLEYSLSPGLSISGPSSSPVSPASSYDSSSVESLFDVILDNEQKFGYTVNSVSLDGKTFTITDADGKTKSLNSDVLLNNALNIVTQQDPTAARTTQSGSDLASQLATTIAGSVNLDATSGDLTSASVLASNDRGVFAMTADGSLVFAPNFKATNSAQGVATSEFKTGDQVIIGNGFVSPSITVKDTKGQTVTTVDALRVDPLSGLGRVIGLNDSQALVVLPNQQVATVDRSNLPANTNQSLKQGSQIAVNQNLLSGINVPAATVEKDFGLTNEDLLRNILTPVTTSQTLPNLVPITTPQGATQMLDTAKPDISVGQIVSIDPTSGTALVSTALGNPQVVNLQGITATQGSDIFFNPSTNTILGTPVVSAPATQTQPQGLGSLVAGTYAPVGTPTGGNINTVTGVQPTVPVSQFPPIGTVLPQESVPGGVQVDTIPGLGVDTIQGIAQDTIPAVTIDTITAPVTPLTPVVPGADTVPGGTKTDVKMPTIPAFPSLFFPIQKSSQTGTKDYEYPTVPPPELSGSYEMPYPNYLRPLDPYLGYGLGTLMGDLNAQEQRNGGDQPLQNAQAQAAPAPR